LMRGYTALAEQPEDRLELFRETWDCQIVE